jgi:hypothetical protein
MPELMPGDWVTPKDGRYKGLVGNLVRVQMLDDSRDLHPVRRIAWVCYPKLSGRIGLHDMENLMPEANLPRGLTILPGRV